MFEEDSKMALALDLWNKMGQDAKDEIIKHIENNKAEYYKGALDHLTQVHKELLIDAEKAKDVCAKLLVLSYLVVNHEDLNLTGKRRYVN